MYLEHRPTTLGKGTSPRNWQHGTLGYRLSGPQSLIQIPALWLPSGGATASCSNYSEPQCSSLQNGCNSAFLTVFMVWTTWDNVWRAQCLPLCGCCFLMSLNTPILQNETATLPKVTGLGMAESEPELRFSNAYLVCSSQNHTTGLLRGSKATGNEGERLRATP